MHYRYLLLKLTRPKQTDGSKNETEVSSIRDSPFHLLQVKWEIETLSSTQASST